MTDIIQAVYFISAILFIGNLFFGLFWKVMADTSKDPKIMYHTFAGIFLSDKIFTLPAMLLILSSNFEINEYKYFIIFPMDISVLFAFFFGVLIFILFVHPIRKQLYQLVQSGFENGESDIKLYNRLSIIWMIWGTLEVIPIVSVLILSIIKF